MSNVSHRIRHPEWRKENSTTNYPFVDEASLRNAAGKFIPEGTLVDAAIYPIGGQAGLYLSRVVVTHDTASVYVGDASNTNLASGQVDLVDPANQVRLTDSYGRPAGVLVSAEQRLAIFSAWGIGEHVFTNDATEFLPDVCSPLPEVALRGFILDDGSIFTDDIWLVGDAGVVLSLAEQPLVAGGCDPGSEVAQVIRVDVVGDPLFRRRLCDGNFTTPRFLRTVTAKRGCETIVCGPDSLGDLKITAGHRLAEDTILRVRIANGGLRIEAVGEALEGVR